LRGKKPGWHKEKYNKDGIKRSITKLTKLTMPLTELMVLDTELVLGTATLSMESEKSTASQRDILSCARPRSIMRPRWIQIKAQVGIRVNTNGSHGALPVIGAQLKITAIAPPPINVMKSPAIKPTERIMAATVRTKKLDRPSGLLALFHASRDKSSRGTAISTTLTTVRLAAPCMAFWAAAGLVAANCEREREDVLDIKVYKKFEYVDTRMVGDEGFEPPNGGVKVHCLTTWLIPNALQTLDSGYIIQNWGILQVFISWAY
jgi:hypothetical protein